MFMGLSLQQRGVLKWKIRSRMKNSVSDQSFYIESDEEDEENVSNRDNNDGNDSDSSHSSSDNEQQNKTNSYITSWPQSYRYIISFLVLLSSVLMNLLDGLLLRLPFSNRKFLNIQMIFILGQTSWERMWYFSLVFVVKHECSRRPCVFNLNFQNSTGCYHGWENCGKFS